MTQMPLRFNPRTGEWEEYEQKGDNTPSALTIAGIGNWFGSFWDDKQDTSAWVLVFVPLIVLSIISRLALVAIIVLCLIPFTRNLLTIVSFMVMVPVAWVLRWVFYNAWSLAASVCLAIGILYGNF